MQAQRSWRELVSGWLPASMRAARLQVARRAAAGLALLVAAALVFAVVSVRRGQAEPASLDVAPASGAYRSQRSGAPEAMPSPGPTPRQLVVDVEGKVHQPGVHGVPVGSRVVDALAAAGGALPGVDLTTLDLAARLSDGQQLRVGLPGGAAGTAGDTGTPVTTAGGAGGSGGAAGSGTPDPGNPVDLNTASSTELDALPGIGPALAARIVAWRDAHGDFASVQELGRVPGLGGKKLATLAPLVRV